MGGLSEFSTVRVEREDSICRLQLYRPQSQNTINPTMVEECSRVLDDCESWATVVVLEGLPEVFSFGADFQEIGQGGATPDPGRLYDLWLRLATGSFVSVAHVEGKVNAGGVGFVAACDVVLCKTGVPFSLSELLFGLMPACVLPFLVRRMGPSKAHYMTLMTQPIRAEQALEWGLVDALDDNPANLLRKHLLRLRRLNKTAVRRYKTYMNAMTDMLVATKPLALRANEEVFSDPENRRVISRFVETGKLPWQKDT